MRLRIDHIALEADDARYAADTLKDALELLAARLAQTPHGEEATDKALALIELGPFAPGYLATPAASARIADDLYREIVRARA
jgi:hypothetical protein